MSAIYKKLNLGSAKPYFNRTASAFRRVGKLVSREIESYVEQRIKPETELKISIYPAVTSPLTALAVSIAINNEIIGIIACILQFGVGIKLIDHALERIYPTPTRADIPFYITKELYKL